MAQTFKFEDGLGEDPKKTSTKGPTGAPTPAIDKIAEEYKIKGYKPIGAQKDRDFYPGADLDKYQEYLPNYVYTPETAEGGLRSLGIMQPWTHQAWRGVAGGVLSGLSTFVEDLSYIPNVITQDFEGNVISEASKQFKNNIREEYMPIYKKDLESTFAWGDSAFYFSSAREILDSAIGFGLMGGTTALGIKGIGKLSAKLTKMAASGAKAASTRNRLAALDKILTGKYGQGASALAGGIFMNDLEGTMMGIEVYEQAMEEFAPDIISKKITEEQAMIEANKAASEFKLYNRMFAATDAIGLLGLTGAATRTRNILRTPGWKGRFKEMTNSALGLNADNLLLQGSKEALEEIGQNALQAEELYNIRQKTSQPDYEDKRLENMSKADRLIHFGTRTEALYEGLLGFLGGGPQRILSEVSSGKYGKKAREQQANLYALQQQQLANNLKFVTENLKSEGDYQTALNKAVEDGDEAAIQALKENKSLDLFVRNFEAGTTDNLETTLQEIADGNFPPQMQGFTQEEKEEATKNANELLEKLPEVEKSWLAYSQYANGGELWITDQQRKIAKDVIKNYQKQKNTLQETIRENAESLASNSKVAQAVRNELGDNKVADLEGLTEADKKEVNAIVKKAYASKEAQDLYGDDGIVNTIKKMQTYQSDLETKLADGISGKAQKALAKAQAEAIKKAQEAIEKKKKATALAANKTQNKPTAPANPAPVTPNAPAAPATGQNPAPNTPVTQTPPPAVEDPETNPILKAKLETVVEKLLNQEPLEQEESDLHAKYTNWITEKIQENINKAPVKTPKGDDDSQGHVTSKTEESTKAEIEEVNSALNANNVSNDTQKVRSEADYDYKRSEEGSSLIAYLARKYNQFYDAITRIFSRADINNFPNDLSLIMDPNEIKPGRQLIFKVADNDDIEVYDPNSTTKEKITWGTKKAYYAENARKAGIPLEEYVLYMNEVPIAIFDANTGTQIGYVHEVSWINEENIYGPISEDIKALQGIRSKILTSPDKTLSGKVSDRTDGYLIKATGDTPPRTNRALPDSKLSIVFGRNNQLHVTRNETLKDEVNNKKIGHGALYVVVPTGNTKTALPLLRPTFNSTELAGIGESVSYTALKAIELYLKFNPTNAKPFLEKEDEAIYNLFRQIGHDVTTIEGVVSVLERFIKNTYLSDVTIADGDLNQITTFLKTTDITEGTPIFSFDTKGGANNRGSISFGKAGLNLGASLQLQGLENAYGFSLSPENFQKMSQKNRDAILGKLKEVLAQSRVNYNSNLVKIKEKVSILQPSGSIQTFDNYTEFIKNLTTSPFIAFNLGTNENPNYVYTIQAKVSFALDEQAKKADIKGTTQTTKPKATQTPTATPVKDFVITAQIGDTFEVLFPKDISPEWTEVTVVDYYGELGATFSDDNDTVRLNSDMFTDEAAQIRNIKRVAPPKSASSKISKYKDARNKIKGKTNKFGEDDVIEELMIPSKVSRKIEKELKNEKLSGWSAAQQDAIIQYHTYVIYQKLVINKEKVALSDIIKELKAEYNNTIAEATEVIAAIEKDIAASKDAAEIAELKVILSDIKNDKDKNTSLADNINLIIDEVQSRLKVYGVRITEEKNIAKIKANKEAKKDVNSLEEEADEEESEASGENYSKTALQVDGKQKLSGELKLFLTFIPRVDAAGNIIENSFIPFDEVYETLHKLLEGESPSYISIVSRLKEMTQTFPWANEVVTLLEDAAQKGNSNIVNAFVSEMGSRHYIKMRFMQMYKNEEGVIGFREMYANSAEEAGVLGNMWHERLKTKSNIWNVTNGSITLYDEARATITAAFNDLKGRIVNQPREEATKQKLKEFTEMYFGITIPAFILNDIISGSYTKGKIKGKKVKGSLTLKDQFESKQGIFYTLNQIAQDTTANLYNKPIYNYDAIQSLRNKAAWITDNLQSNSMRSGNKTIYSYGANKFLINRTKRLIEEIRTFRSTGEKGQLIAEIESDPFSKDNPFFKQLMYAESKMITEDGGDFDTFYLNLEALKERGKASRDYRELHNLSVFEHELTKLGFFTANINLTDNSSDYKGNKVQYRRAAMMYPTTSDKTTVHMHHVNTIAPQFNTDGTLAGVTLDYLYDSVVQGEINRIKSDKPSNIAGYDEGRKQFLFTPRLNTVKLADGTGIIEAIETGRPEAEIKAAIIPVFKEYINAQIQEKIKVWEDLGITEFGEGKSYPEYVDNKYWNKVAKGTNSADKLKYLATDYVTNYIAHNSGMYATYIGDPALYYKSQQKEVLNRLSPPEKARASSMSNNKFRQTFYTEEDYIKESQATFNNAGKRLAADIAPGTELALHEKMPRSITTAFLKDSEGVSLTYSFLEKTLGKEKAANYKKINGTDAQEFTSWQEHLNVVYGLGQISAETYEAVSKKLKAQEAVKGVIPQELKLNQEEKEIIFQPLKPVYVNNVFDNQAQVNRRVYIKSSSFPLIPELTAGLEIDKLRLKMKASSIDRVAFESAVKIGRVKNPLDIFVRDERGKTNGTISDDFEFVFADNDNPNVDYNTLVIPRDGFRIQQEIPYKEKAKDVKGSQEKKLLFADILGVEGFIYEGEAYKGKELYNEYMKLNRQIFELKSEAFIKSFTTEEGTADIEKIVNILKDSAEERGISKEILSLLEVKDGKLVYPLYLHGKSLQLQAVLTSLISKRIIENTSKGKSYVLGTEEGFKPQIQEGGPIPTNVIFTDSYDKEKGLQGLREENGKILPAQIIVPFNVATRDGKILKLADYIKDGKLDTEKLPKEVLKLFGFRIPTQGKNSMNLLEVVGFLPETSGDLLIAPRDFTVQMGSDFDVDKINTYFTQVIEDADGNLLKTTEENVRKVAISNYKLKQHPKLTQEEYVDKMVNSFKEAILSNKILDIHISVLTNPKVQNKIHEPLGFGKLQDIKKKYQSKIATNLNFFPLSEQYQKNKFINATAGKAGIGKFSLDSVFAAAIQTIDKEIRPFQADSNRPNVNVFEFAFAGIKGKGVLNNPTTLTDKNRTIIDVIAAFQSAAVDNENEQILDVIHVNSDTFPVITTLALMGYEEDAITALLTQPIVIDYVNALRNNKAKLSRTDAEEATLEYIKAKYGVETKDATDLGVNDMELLKDSSGEEFNNYQNGLLDIFLKSHKIGTDIGKVQSLTNLDSKGLGKNIFEADLKLSKDLITSGRNNYLGQNIENAEAILTNNTLNGLVYNYTQEAFKLLTGALFPYHVSHTNEGATMLTLIDNLKMIGENKSDRFSVNSEAEKRNEIFKDIISYLHTSKELELFQEESTSDARKRLMLDTKENKSLATIVLNLQEKHKGLKENAFFSRLVATINQEKGQASTVHYNAASADLFNEQVIYNGIKSLFRNPKGEIGLVAGFENDSDYTREQLIEDLIKYSFLEGGVQEAVQFFKYLPSTYLINNGIPQALDKFIQDFIKEEEYTDVTFKRLLIQRAQHKSYLNPAITENLITKGAVISHKMYSAESNKVVDMELSTFSLNEEGSKKWGTRLPGGELQLPIFFNRAVKVGNKEVNILYINSGGVYYPINKLGQAKMREYDASKKEWTSVIPRNLLNAAEAIPQTHNKSEIGLRNEEDETSYYDFAADLGLPNITKVNDLLGSLITASNKMEDTAFAELFKLYRKLPYNKAVPVYLKPEQTLEPKGKVSVINGEVSSLTLNASDDISYLVNTAAHELTHVFTIEALNDAKAKYGKEEWKDVNPKVKKAYTRILQSMQKAGKSIVASWSEEVVVEEAARITAIYKRSVPSKNAEEIFTSLLHNVGVTAKKEHWTAFEKYLATNEELEMTDKSAILYSFYNSKEFVAQALSKKEFQEILNEIPGEKADTSFLEDIFDAILDFFGSYLNALSEKLGTPVVKDNLLYQTIEDSMLLISSEIEVTTPLENTSEKVEVGEEEVVPGSVVSYKGKKYLLWNINESGKAQLTDSTGAKFAGTPMLNKLENTGVIFPTVEYNNNTFYILPGNVLISAANGKEVYNTPAGAEMKRQILNKYVDNAPKPKPTNDEMYELFPGVYANEEQQEAIDALLEFIGNKKDSLFTLTGRGGTGKTTIIKKIAQAVDSNDVIYMAPTHKAKNILSASVDATSFTLESALAISLNENTGEFTPNEYKRSKEEVPIKGKKLIIIDESSMIKDNMLEEIFAMKDADAQIIFMGDNAQLPPVGQITDSKVFEYKGKTLTQRMRQDEGSPIVSLSDVVAANVENDTSRKVRIIEERVAKINEEANEGLWFEHDLNKVLDMFVADYKTAPDSTRMVTFNNHNYKNSSQSVLNLNSQIRERLYGKNAEEFYEGEQLMAYDSLFADVSLLLENSMEYTIKELGPLQQSTNSIHAYSKKLGLRTVVIKVPFHRMKLENNITKKTVIIDVPTAAGKAAIEKHITEQVAKKDYQMKHRINESFANLNYSYAITSHKAQGSTYRNTYVMEDNILGPTNLGTPKAKNQSLYVGISRASKKLVMHSVLNKGVMKFNTTTAQEEEKAPNKEDMTGDVIEELSLGGSVNQYLNKLPKEARAEARELIKAKRIQFKC